MKRNRVILPCKECGKMTEIIKSREASFRFCSKPCHGRNILSSPIVQAKIRHKFGAENNRWKGGRRKHTSGYVWILFEKKYILEHRHIMQQHLGRSLSRREQVHHLNGDKLDNRLENLELVDIAEHTRKHHLEGLFRPRGWSRNFDSCRSCNQSLKPHKARGLCRKCYRLETGQ